MPDPAQSRSAQRPLPALSSPPELNIGGEVQKISDPDESEVVSLATLFSDFLARAELTKEESFEAQRHRLWRATIESVAGTLLKLVGFVVVVLILSRAADILESSQSTPEIKKLAEDAIVLIIGAITGFSIGKGQK